MKTFWSVWLLGWSGRAICSSAPLVGGRWVLIADDGEETLLFHDPCGFRQVHYTEKSFPERWCTSQPKILQEELKLEADPEALSEFVESSYFKNERCPWWPGSSTLYREVRRLLPNRYLNLRSWAIHRFWPWKKAGAISLEEGVERAADLLCKLVLAANARFDLALSLTAGFDSRTLLAAAREVSTDIYYFTTVHYDMTRWDSDVRVPAKLLSKLGLEHHVIDCPSSMSEEFARMYRHNASIPCERRGTIAQGMYERYPKERVWVKGNGAEITRCFYYDPASYPERKDGKALAALAWFGENSFAIRHFGKWLEKAWEVEDRVVAKE